MGLDRTLNYLLNQYCDILSINPELPTLMNVVFLIPISFTIFIVILIFIALYIGKENKKKITKIFETYAKANNAEYLGDSSWGINPIVSGTPLGLGDTYGKYAMVHYVDNKTVNTRIWTTEVGSGDDGDVTRYQIAVMPINFRKKGWIYTRPERYLDRLGNFFGSNDLDFEDQDFSNKYYVRASPEKFGYDFFHPRMMQLFLDYPDFHVIVKPDYLLVYFEVSCNLSGYFALRKYSIVNLREIEWMESAKKMAIEVEKMIPSFMREDT